MAGLNANASGALDGIDHALQSFEKLLMTRLGDRVDREWCGNPGVKLLGENATAKTIALWFTIVWMLAELFEPRLKIKRFIPIEVTREGGFEHFMDIEFRPYAHLNWVQARAFVAVENGTVRMQRV